MSANTEICFAGECHTGHDFVKVDNGSMRVMITVVDWRKDKSIGVLLSPLEAIKIADELYRRAALVTESKTKEVML